MKKILVVFALEEERFQINIKGVELTEIVTGVGKTQAAATVALAIDNLRPDMVLNVDTAGTWRHKVGDILVARRFIDRDMQKLPIATVSKEINMTDSSFGYALKSVVNARESNDVMTINTGDNFVTSVEEDLGCDAVDMESFAIAWVCKKMGVSFLSVKYITDVLGSNSIEAWSEKLSHARRDLKHYFDNEGDKLTTVC
ncbi:MAG: nucleosidase [Bacteroidaceae bacterium]